MESFNGRLGCFAHFLRDCYSVIENKRSALIFCQSVHIWISVLVSHEQHRQVLPFLRVHVGDRLRAVEAEMQDLVRIHIRR
jgi:hypothetical protein